jgi:transcriptional regulator with XRE-family HTH domain
MEKSTHTTEYAALRSELCLARKNAGLSQRQLATRLQVPHSWVAKVENGERRIDLVEFGWFLSACGADSRQVANRLLMPVQIRKAGRQTKGGRR